SHSHRHHVGDCLASPVDGFCLRPPHPAGPASAILGWTMSTSGEPPMTRSTLILALAASACVTSAVAQTSSPPRHDLPQPYRTPRDGGELPAGMKWAAVTSIEAAADGSIFVIHRCAANSCAGRPEPPILKFDANGKL